MTDLAFRCELLALVGVLAAGCGYPSFEFRSSNKATTTHTTATPDAGGAGGGGSGGSGGSATGKGGSAGAGGAVRPDVRVNCTAASTVCAAGEVCCYHEQKFACDHCSAKGPCDANDANGACAGKYHVLACSRNADCTAGNVCCGTVADAQGSPVLFGTTCAPSCTLEITYIMCKGNEDCSPGQTCKKLGYAGYGFCPK